MNEPLNDYFRMISRSLLLWINHLGEYESADAEDLRLALCEARDSIRKEYRQDAAILDQNSLWREVDQEMNSLHKAYSYDPGTQA